MIKKLLGGLAVVGLCAGAALYLSSCAQQAGPLNPSLDLLNASSTRGDLPIATFIAPSSVSQTATVTFDLPMNPATINTSTIQVYQQAADGLSENLLAGYTVAYNPGPQQAIVTPNGGVWPTDARYHIVATTSCRSMGGDQLDGNGNNIPEDPTFDNEHNVFTFDDAGTPATPPVNFTDPRGYISAAVAVNGTNLVSEGYIGNISAVYSYVTITVSLALAGGSSSDPNFAFDATTFFTNATTLHPNVRITDANGTMLTPVNAAVTGTMNETLTIELALQPATKYYVELKGGYTGIRTSSAANAAVARDLHLNGSDTHEDEMVDDWKKATIMTANVDNSAMPAFTVSEAYYISTSRTVEVLFDIPNGIGTGTLNASTVNNTSVLLIDIDDNDVADDQADKPIAASSIQLQNYDTRITGAPEPSNPRVILYVPLKFSADSGDEHTHTVRIIVTTAVRTAEGLAMDNNGDGVSGTLADVYSTTVNIKNYQQ